MGKPRIAYYDFLRAVGIIGVLVIHTCRFDGSGWSFYANVILRQAVNFAVPLFVALSGFLLAEKQLSSKKEYFSFLRTHFPRILIPFFLWSIVYILPLVPHRVPLSELVWMIVTFQGCFTFYFLALILQFYLLLPLLQRIATGKGLVLSLVISGLCWLGIFYLDHPNRVQLPIIIYKGLFPTLLFFFVLGIYLRKRPVFLPGKMAAILLPAGLFGAVVETLYRFELHGPVDYALTTAKASSAFLSTVFIVWVLSREATFTSEKSGKMMKFCVWVGQVSFGIYLSHIIILAVVRNGIERVFPTIAAQNVPMQLLEFWGTFIGCLIFAWVCRRVNKRWAVFLLGQG